MEYIEQAVLKTLVYSDIFDFPLTKEELWKFLISKKRVKKEQFDKVISSLSTKNIFSKDGYYCLSGREEIIIKRQKNLKDVEEKLRTAQKAASHLYQIPSILFIGISGGLSMGDAGPTDDIDFFIITKNKTLFKTRLSIFLILEILGLRRGRSSSVAADKICVNLLIDETSLSWEEGLRDLYTAHEILQLKPLFQRQNIYGKFLKANDWIKNFFPNASVLEPEKFPKVSQIGDFGIKAVTYIVDLILPESLNRLLQLSYMGKHTEKEIVTKHVLMFHPKDYRSQTLKRMRLKLRQLGLLTKA